MEDVNLWHKAHSMEHINTLAFEQKNKKIIIK